MGGRGLEQLVDAMTDVSDVDLVLLGDGPQAPSLRSRSTRLGIADRVHFVEPVPPSQVVSHAAWATVGVMPIVPSSLNNRYSLPNKLFQYMQAGIAVVATDFPQVREVVNGARCGVLVDTTRPEAIAAGIRAVLADPANARAMGARGAAAVADRYTWDVVSLASGALRPRPQRQVPGAVSDGREPNSIASSMMRHASSTPSQPRTSVARFSRVL